MSSKQPAIRPDLSVPFPRFRWRLDGTVTVGRALVAATQRLNDARIDTARLDSEVLLANVLGWERSRLYMESERLLESGERRRYEGLIERRYRYEPVAYLVGRKAFFGLDLAVDRRVLIPRPETELLVELALDLLPQLEERQGALASNNGHDPFPTIVDVGTGSGAIALAVAANHRRSRLFATDYSEAALELARGNAERLGLVQRITFLQGDLLTPLTEPVDLILANLPYVAGSEWQDLSPDIANFEPPLALAGGSDGLRLIERLLDQAPAFLRPGGAVALEIGNRQGALVADMAARRFPTAEIEVIFDYGHRDRIVWIKTDAEQ